MRPENGLSSVEIAPPYDVAANTSSMAGFELHTCNRFWFDTVVIARANCVALPAPLVSLRDAARSTDTRKSLRWLLSGNRTYSSFSVSDTMLSAFTWPPLGSVTGPVTERKYASVVGSTA